VGVRVGDVVVGVGVGVSLGEGVGPGDSVGVGLGDGEAPTPVPDSATCCGLPAASSVMSREAADSPVTCGAKATFTVQESPTPTVVVLHASSDVMKLPAPAPLRPTESTVNGAVPEFVTVTV